MILRYRPDDGPEVEFDFRPGDLETPESEAVEAVGGETWGTYEEWGALFFRGSQKARRAALWIFLRRTNPRLKFEDVRIRADQTAVDYSLRERNKIIEVMLTDPNIDDEQRAALTEMVTGGADVDDINHGLNQAGVEPDLERPKDQRQNSGDAASM